MKSDDNQAKVMRTKHLIRNLGLSNGRFADEIGVDRGEMSRYLNEKQPITDKLILKIVDRFPNISFAWLYCGTGDMDVNNDKKTEMQQETKEQKQSIGKSNGTPYYDLDAAACGSMAGFGQALTDSNNSGYISLPFLKTREGDMFIQTRGRSMIDAECPERSIPEGAIVLIRNWRERHIEWGEIYCLVTADGYVVKKLMPGDDDSHIKCVSADSINYPPFSVALSDIQGIARVVAVVSTTVL